MEKKTNILWIMTDEQRTDSLGCYGSTWAKTPNLDRLAQEGVMITNAITPAPVCVPARFSMLTGKYPVKTGVWWNKDQGEGCDFLTETIKKAGYRTASFGKQHYNSDQKAFSTEEQIVLSNDVDYFHYSEEYDEANYDVIKYPSQPNSWIFGGHFPEDSKYTAEARVCQKAKEWLQKLETGVPFLLRLSFNAPHTPVAPPEPYGDLIDIDKINISQETEEFPVNAPDWLTNTLAQYAKSSRLTEKQIAELRGYYYGSAAFVDKLIGDFLEWMNLKGYLEDTMIVFVSDHGTHLGDFRLMQKQTCYEPVVKVPLLFWYPDKFVENHKIKTPVSTKDILPTLLDIIGVDCNEKGSLKTSLLTGEEPESKPIFSDFILSTYGQPHGKLTMVRYKHWKQAIYFDPEPIEGELYYLKKDPQERENLYNESDTKNVRYELTELILKHLN